MLAALRLIGAVIVVVAPLHSRIPSNNYHYIAILHHHVVSQEGSVEGHHPR